MAEFRFLTGEDRLEDFKKLATYVQRRDWTLAAGDPLFVVNKFGQNLDIDANIQEDIWSAGGARAIFTSAEIFNLVSTDANDTSAGTGGRSVYIQGLDSNYNYQFELVTLNGTTNVPTTLEYVEIYRMIVFSSGTSKKNAGAITATGATSGNVIAHISVGYGITQQTHFTIPTDYTGFLIHKTFTSFRSAGGTGTRSAEIFENAKLSITDNTELKLSTYGVDGVVDVEPGIPDRFPSRTLGWYSANAPANNTAVTCQWQLLCIKNDLCT